MKTLLFPRWCRFAGFVIFPVSLVLCLATLNYGFEFNFLQTSKAVAKTNDLTFNNHNLTDEFSYAGIIIALFMIGFSKLKTEDEYTKHVRLRSLNLTVYLNYLFVLFIIFFVYGFEFLMTIAWGIIAIPVLYIIILNFNLYIRPHLAPKASA